MMHIRDIIPVTSQNRCTCPISQRTLWTIRTYNINNVIADGQLHTERGQQRPRRGNKHWRIDWCGPPVHICKHKLGRWRSWMQSGHRWSETTLLLWTAPELQALSADQRPTGLAFSSTHVWAWTLSMCIDTQREHIRVNILLCLQFPPFQKGQTCPTAKPRCAHKEMSTTVFYFFAPQRLVKFKRLRRW